MNQVTTTIRKERDEWIVRVRVNGIRRPSADYFTDNKLDAEETAKLIHLDQFLAPCPDGTDGI